MRAANKEKFKEVVIKLTNSVPNKPLSESQNRLIHDRLNRFLSVLHTPDHPPYAWMIERALRELNERGGSSEESISNFIRKQYDDLPWSHFTLLKHHLEVLCNCGDIILTHGQHYLLAGADSTLKSGKECRRKSTRRKRDCDWEIKQRKRHKKDIGKRSPLQKEDLVHEKRNQMVGGLKQQKPEAEDRKDTPQLCIIGDDGEQIERDQIEISTPEKPPGFESATLEKSSHSPVCCTENLSQGTHPTERPPEVAVSAVEGLSGHQEQVHLFNANGQLNLEEQMILSAHGTPETSVDQTLQELQPVTTTNGIGLRQNKYEEHPAMPNQARPTEFCSQKKLTESELAKNTAAITETGPINLAGGKQGSHIMFKYRRRPHVVQVAKEKDLSCATQETKEELLQQRQLKRQGQKHLDDNPAASPLLQRQLQEHELSNTDELQQVKSGAANRSEHQGLPIPAVKSLCEEQQYQQEIIEVPDNRPAASSLLQHQPQENVSSVTNEPQEVKSGAANRAEHQELQIPGARPSCEDHHQSEAIIGVPEGPAVSSKLSICFKWPNGGDAHEVSALPSPSELEPMDVEESLETARLQWQRKRGSKQLSNFERPQSEYQAPMESTRVTRKQAKLYSQEKRNAGQLKVALVSSVAVKQVDSQEFSKFASLQMHPELEPKIETSKHQAEDRVSQENPSCRILRPRHLKPELSNALTTAEFSPSHHQHDVQQQPKYSCQGRPPKAKPDDGFMNDKVVTFPNPHPRQQSEEPKHERRGRPPKSKLGASTIINKKLLSGTQQHRPKNSGRGRPRKAVDGE